MKSFLDIEFNEVEKERRRNQHRYCQVFRTLGDQISIQVDSNDVLCFLHTANATTTEDCLNYVTCVTGSAASSFCITGQLNWCLVVANRLSKDYPHKTMPILLPKITKHCTFIFDFSKPGPYAISFEYCQTETVQRFMSIRERPFYFYQRQDGPRAVFSDAGRHTALLLKIPDPFKFEKICIEINQTRFEWTADQVNTLNWRRQNLKPNRYAFLPFSDHAFDANLANRCAHLSSPVFSNLLTERKETSTQSLTIYFQGSFGRLEEVSLAVVSVSQQFD